MYSMILLDDEKIVLQGIQKVFHMEDYGFEITGVFSNPVKALEELPRLMPQLIITDVKMPQMNGLEFSAKAKEICPEAEIVILSGYDDFSNAQHALKLGVSDYLLKPIKKSDFVAMLRQMYEKIDEKLGQAAYFQSLQEYAKSNVRELKNHFFLEMAEKNSYDDPSIRTFCDEMQLPIYGQNFVLVKLVILDIGTDLDYMSGVGRLVEEFEQKIRTCLDASGGVVCTEVGVELFVSDEELYFFLYGEGCKENRDEIVQLVRDFVTDQGQNGMRLAAGVSRIQSDLHQLLVARNECDDQILVEQSRLQRPEGGSLQLADADITIPYQDVEALFSGISMNSAEQMRDSIERIYQQPVNMLYKDFSCSLTFMILLRLSHLMNCYDQSRDLIPREVLDIRTLKREYPRIVQQKELVANTAFVLADLIAKKEVASPKKIVRDAMNYIRAHYNENITLTNVAEHINISKNYLCDIFKKELNITFINYVMNMRIEKAKELLTTTDMKMYEIAETVGYHDYAYFSQIFKRHTGTTLSTYRHRN